MFSLVCNDSQHVQDHHHLHKLKSFSCAKITVSDFRGLLGKAQKSGVVLVCLSRKICLYPCRLLFSSYKSHMMYQTFQCVGLNINSQLI